MSNNWTYEEKEKSIIFLQTGNRYKIVYSRCLNSYSVLSLEKDDEGIPLETYGGYRSLEVAKQVAEFHNSRKEVAMVDQSRLNSWAEFIKNNLKSITGGKI